MSVKRPSTISQFPFIKLEVLDGKPHIQKGVTRIAVVCSHQVTSDLVWCIVFWKSLRWWSRKAVSVPTIIGPLSVLQRFLSGRERNLSSYATAVLEMHAYPWCKPKSLLALQAWSVPSEIMFCRQEQKELTVSCAQISETENEMKRIELLGQNGGLAHYVIAVASHNVKHAWVLDWVASRFVASSCALHFSHFAIVLLFSWTKFFTKAKSQCLFRCTSRAIRYISMSVYRLPLSSGPQFSRNVSVRGP